MATITEIKLQKKLKNRASIFVDGHFFCGAPIEIIVKNNILKGQEIDETRLKEICFAADSLTATEKAIKLVSKMLKTEKEVNNYLSLKGYSSDVIAQTICKLKEYKYINDESYVDSYISTYSYSQGVNKIKQVLLLKGVDKELIKSKLETLDFNAETLEKIAQKWAKDKEMNLNNKGKLFKFLLAKGYLPEQIKSISFFKGEDLE